MAYQDMMDGRGFAFIDPHGDLVESLLGKVPKERVEDIIYFNPADMTNPIGLNMFEFDTPRPKKTFLVQEAIKLCCMAFTIQDIRELLVLAWSIFLETALYC